MYLARVVGPVVTPVQHRFFDGRTLLLVRRVGLDGAEAGPDRVAVDRVQAGEGDLVLVLEEGNSARQIVDDPMAPLRSVVVGFVDEVELDGSVVASNDGRERARAATPRPPTLAPREPPNGPTPPPSAPKRRRRRTRGEGEGERKP
jgi:ethanolamine utilization protein EutN